MVMASMSEQENEIMITFFEALEPRETRKGSKSNNHN